METDERFEHLASDPRFKNLRKKQKKIEIDDRFKSMFTDEKFTLKYSKDKRGKNQKKTSGDDLKKYYSLNEDSDRKRKQNVEESHAPDKKQEDEDREDSVDYNSDEEEDEKSDSNVEHVASDEQETGSESELSSSSDESDSELEDDAGNDRNEIDIDKLNYDWQPLDHDAEVAEKSSRRLAIQNLDWDYLDVKDIYTLIHSVRPPLFVKIYVSEFGRERLKREAIEGPKEIVEMPRVDEEEEEYNQLRDKMRALKNLEPKAHRVNEYEDADEEIDPRNEEMRERVRKYQLNRMKYYYAIVEFDSIESAELVYKELDGREYEGSSLELDLRFVPDDVEFDDEDVKEECDKLPDLTSYQAPQFINSALQQTTVKFTWDETDAKRQDKLFKAYTKEELDKDDLEAYLASETDSDEEFEDKESDDSREGDAVSVVTANSEARANKYKMLLQSLEEEEERKKKVDVDVEWGKYSDDEHKTDSLQSEGEEVEDESFDRGSDEEDNEESETENQSRPLDKREMKRIIKKEKREKHKKKNKHENKIDAKATSDSVDDDLDLLVMDADSKRDDFQFDPDDHRFQAIYESGLYNIDPSHPNFKRTKALEVIAEKKREKRHKTR